MPVFFLNNFVKYSITPVLLDNLEWPELLLALNLRFVKFATDETLGIEDRVFRVCVVGVLSGVSDTIARCEY